MEQGTSTPAIDELVAHFVQAETTMRKAAETQPLYSALDVAAQERVRNTAISMSAFHMGMVMMKNEPVVAIRLLDEMAEHIPGFGKEEHNGV